MIKKLTDLQTLSLDVYKGKVEKFSVAQGEDAIRNAIKDVCDGEWNYYKFMAHKYEVFQVMSEVLSLSTGNLLTDAFNGFVEVRDTELGDSTEFIIEDQDLFRVSAMATGTKDIRRQAIFQKRLSITTFDLGVKIYTEFDRFMAGRIDWTSTVNRVALSFQNKIGELIYNAIMNTYDDLLAPYQVAGSFQADKLNDLVAHVEAKTGKSAIIYGTKKALSKIPYRDYGYRYMSEENKNELNQNGYLKLFEGTTCVELPQAHVSGKDEFAISDDYLLVIPNGEKIVKLVLEGEPYVDEGDGKARTDKQIEYEFNRKIGLGVLKANRYGIMKLS